MARRSENNKAGILDDASRPSKWLFTHAGLKVTFSAYAGGCYACTPQPITIAWPSLKPILAPDAVVP